MLNRIRVKNFKSFKNLDYRCAQLNLLVGVNGAGKSSFIQLLLFLKAISGRGLNNTIIRAKEIGFMGNFSSPFPILKKFSCGCQPKSMKGCKFLSAI